MGLKRAMAAIHPVSASRGRVAVVRKANGKKRMKLELTAPADPVLSAMA